MEGKGLAENIVRELEGGEHGSPCFVRHPDAGGLCGRPAEMMVYGLRFCEVHGAEIKAGALVEVYQDAADFIERLDNPFGAPVNPEALQAVRQTSGELSNRVSDGQEDQALRRAYPATPERVDEDIRDHDYRLPCESPLDEYYRSRSVLHGMMRRAHVEGFVWLVELLEVERERVSAQAAFALEDYARRFGTPTNAGG